MKPLKEKISITIDSDVLETLRHEAEEDERSLSQYINLILSRHIRESENEQKQ
ncbi:MAG: toxin-antitoxin system protein [Ruminococcaceae bacterium]|nr:toxin-antitoxin system protein [Oscillospiraceae bacterium]